MRLPTVLSLALAASTLHAQAITGDKQIAILTAARSQYYSLRVAGASSFTCNVDVDWNSIFLSVAGQALPADNPLMQAFNNSVLTVHVDLAGDGTVKSEWAKDTPNPSEEYQKSFDQMRGGTRQAVEGFYQSWFNTFTGSIVPLKVKSLTANPQGFLVDHSDAAKGNLDRITMDKSYLINHLYSKSADTLAEVDTTFTPSPSGLVMTKLDANYQSPPSAPPTHIVMTTTFQPVDGFQIPATLEATVVNVATFSMKFNGCKVEKRT